MFLRSSSLRDSALPPKTRRDENNADLQALVSGVSPSNPNRSEYLFDHIDIPAMLNYATAGIVSQDFDRWAKNFYVYRDTNGSGEWLQIPHDKEQALALAHEVRVACHGVASATCERQSHSQQHERTENDFLSSL